jgi:hypothetical protein
LEYDHLTKRVLDESAGVRDYWLAHPIDCVIALHTLIDGLYGGPEISEMAGARSPAIFPEIVIDFQAILEKLSNSSAASSEKQA